MNFHMEVQVEVVIIEKEWRHYNGLLGHVLNEMRGKIAR